MRECIDTGIQTVRFSTRRILPKPRRERSCLSDGSKFAALPVRYLHSWSCRHLTGIDISDRPRPLREHDILRIGLQAPAWLSVLQLFERSPVRSHFPLVQLEPRRPGNHPWRPEEHPRTAGNSADAQEYRFEGYSHVASCVEPSGRATALCMWQTSTSHLAHHREAQLPEPAANDLYRRVWMVSSDGILGTWYEAAIQRPRKALHRGGDFTQVGIRRIDSHW